MTDTFKVVNGDVQLSSATGRIRLVDRREKLRQDVKQNLEMAPQVNGTGAGLSELVGLASSPVVLAAEVSRRIRSSFEALKQVQRGQQQDRTPEESVAYVTDIAVGPIADPLTKSPSFTTYAYRVRVVSVARADPFDTGGVIME